MKHIKKFTQKKKKETDEISFDSSTLMSKEKDTMGVGIKTDKVEHDEKELNKLKKNKVEKFESFITINIDNIENVEWENEFGENEGDFDESECGCCDDCTGENGCECGCKDCQCNDEVYDEIEKVSDSLDTISENIKYHLKNGVPITENIFRPGSQSFFNLLKEARQLFDSNKIELCKIDKVLYETTDIGKFAKIKGELVPLDLPMEYVEEVNEAKKGNKKVKLNHPMRNTSGSGKKYYVYVKNPKTKKIKKVSFGDVKGGLTTKINDPAARRSFIARHRCRRKWKPSDKLSAGYWSCHLPRYKNIYSGTYSGYW